MADTAERLHNCLYFNANAFARAITRTADDCFKPAGLSPSHGFVLLVVGDRPGIDQKTLARELRLAPSTITRFVDRLEARDLVVRSHEGKGVQIALTYAGRALVPGLQAAWRRLYERYAEILGLEAADELSGQLNGAVEALENE